MKTWLIIFVLFFSVTILSQSQPVNYPLQVGDRWEYRDWYTSNTIRVQVIKDSVFLDGYSYAVLNGTGSIYQRQSGDSVFEFDGIEGKARLLYRFSSAIG